ncbi:MAG: hypothetical protein KDK45_23505, partial [Leptospiraceae bacterium]|nr:hypothetical protein [Leptospiraceae bacterium]
LVYNFEVEDNHTYFVTENAVLVHNYEKGLSRDSLVEAIDYLQGLQRGNLPHEDYEKTLKNMLKESNQEHLLETSLIGKIKYAETIKKLDDYIGKSFFPLPQDDKTGVFIENRSEEEYKKIQDAYSAFSKDGKVKVSIDSNTGEMKIETQEGYDKNDPGNKMLLKLKEVSSKKTISLSYGTHSSLYIDRGKAMSRPSETTARPYDEKAAIDGSGTSTLIKLDPQSVNDTMNLYYTEDTTDSNGIFHKKGEPTTGNYSLDTLLYHETAHAILNAMGASKANQQQNTFFRVVDKEKQTFGNSLTLEEVKVENTKDELYVKETKIINGIKVDTYRPAKKEELQMKLPFPTVCEYLKSKGSKTCRLSY